MFVINVVLRSGYYSLGLNASDACNGELGSEHRVLAEHLKDAPSHWHSRNILCIINSLFSMFCFDLFLKKDTYVRTQQDISSLAPLLLAHCCSPSIHQTCVPDYSILI